MRFAVESWDPSYGASTDAAELDLAQQAIDHEVEVTADQWGPIAPAADLAPAATVVFVDGVRRIDARVWVSHDGGSRPGVCATVGAGAVRTGPGRAEVVDARIHRALYAQPDGADAIDTRAGRYELVPCADDGPEGLYLGIHDQMTKLEREVSADVAADADLVVFDGPLRGRAGAHGVGYVKTQHVQYLPADQQAVLGRLGAGERSPLFLIGHRSYSWYLRLPGPVAHPLAGIVRCEVPGLGPVAEAVRTADLVTRTLPRFASQPHKDGRAPQNLYPIAGLEHALRRRLGDPLLLERALRVASHGT